MSTADKLADADLAIRRRARIAKALPSWVLRAGNPDASECVARVGDLIDLVAAEVKLAVDVVHNRMIDSLIEAEWNGGDEPTQPIPMIVRREPS